jgi:hypothetical protein
MFNVKSHMTTLDETLQNMQVNSNAKLVEASNSPTETKENKTTLKRVNRNVVLLGLLLLGGVFVVHRRHNKASKSATDPSGGDNDDEERDDPLFQAF